jgi:hypothetical protein
VDVQDSLEVPAPPVMLVGLNVQVRPEGVDACVRVTVPVKPFAGVIVTLDMAAVVPSAGVGADGDEIVIEKSGIGTVTVIEVFWARSPLVPVTLTR